MELFEYYITSIFYFLEFPKAEALCLQDSSIKEYCDATLQMLNYSNIIAIILLIISASRVKFLSKAIIFYPVFLIASFYIADISLKTISKTEFFGLENFVIALASYSFFIILLFSICILFRHFEKPATFLAGVISIIFIFVLAYLGRGTFEQYILLAGNSFKDITLNGLLLSYLFQLFIFILLTTIFFSLIDLAVEYIKLGHVHPRFFFLKYIYFFIFSLFISLLLISLPLGNYYNDKDVKEAKSFINSIKEQIDIYYLEYGEYPRIIEDYLPEDENPRLLKRHEFYTMGIRGTYYFSRPEKYCFVFQNPDYDFGYYSLTSNRDWAYSASTDDFENLYISLCDETQESYESLMAGHLNLKNPDDELGKLLIQFNALNTPASSEASSDALHRKILEVGKENPEVFRYFYNPEQEKDN
jgi:hypothetical protein